VNHYLFQAAYTSEAWETLIKHPQNRAEAVRPTFQKMGGDVLASWVCTGEYDLILIAQLPDEAAATAALMAFKAGGALREVKYTRLLTWQEGMNAMTKANESQYQPPT